MNAPNPIIADPPASPSSPSVTFTALVVAQMISPAQMTHTSCGTANPRSSARVSEIVSEIPVAATSHHAAPKLISIVT